MNFLPTRVQVSSKSFIDHVFQKIKCQYFHNTIFFIIILNTNITEHYRALLQLVWSKPKSNENHTNREIHSINNDITNGWLKCKNKKIFYSKIYRKI